MPKGELAGGNFEFTDRQIPAVRASKPYPN